MATKKDDVYKKALEGKRIPILTLDNKWHRLFTMMEPDRELKRLEDNLNSLLKLQGKMNTESKSIKKIKKKLMDEIVQLMDCNDDKRLVCFLKFLDGRLPDVYVIPATAWQNLNEALIYRKYDRPGQSNKPEWGISCANKNLPLLENYRAEKYLEQ